MKDYNQSELDIFNGATSLIELNTGGYTKMPSVKDKAKEYKPNAKVKNISELKEVDTSAAVMEEENAEFPYSYIEVDGQRYKVPVSVLASLNAILEENPKLQKFKVKKSGDGMDTRYTVIPLA